MATGKTIGMQIARAQAGDSGDPSAMNDILSHQTHLAPIVGALVRLTVANAGRNEEEKQ